MIKTIKTYKNYRLPFKSGTAKDFREKPKIIDNKKMVYVALELGIGSAMEVQQIKSKPIKQDGFSNFKKGVNGELK